MDGAPLANPFKVSEAGIAEDWGFKPANNGISHIYDIWWEEEDILIARDYLFSADQIHVEDPPSIDGGKASSVLTTERDGGASDTVDFALELDGGDSNKNEPDALILAKFFGGLRRSGFNLDATNYIKAKDTVMEMLRYLDIEVTKELALKLNDHQVDVLISNHNAGASRHSQYLASIGGSWQKTFEVATATDVRHAVTKAQSDAQVGLTYDGILPPEVVPDPWDNKIPQQSAGLIHDGTHFVLIDIYGRVYRHTELFEIDNESITTQYLGGVITEQSSPGNMDFLTVDPVTGYLIVFWQHYIYSSEDNGYTWEEWNWTAPEEIKRWCWGSDGNQATIIGGANGFIGFHTDFVYANFKSGASAFNSPPNAGDIGTVWIQDVSSGYYDGKHRFVAFCADGNLFYNSQLSNQNWTIADAGFSTQNARFARTRISGLRQHMLIKGNTPASVRVHRTFSGLASDASEIQSSDDFAVGWSFGIHELTDGRLLISGKGAFGGSYWYLSRGGGQFYRRGFIEINNFVVNLVAEVLTNGEVELVYESNGRFATITKNP
jgi:hypothetical protein